MNQDEIIFEVQGKLGLITLNRPKALNALTHAMCVALYEQLNEWRDDEAIGAVLVKGAGEKAFCAGGDVIALYNSGKAYKEGDKTSIAWREFFHDEYRMNAAIADFPKPYIALMDGFTMGGGVGVSVHGSHRVASENTKLSMPETGLGLIPDVGGGYFMPRLNGEMGMYLALTGARVKAGDCLELNICNYYVPSSENDNLIKALATEEKLDSVAVNSVLSQFAQKPDASSLLEYKEIIDNCFSKASLEEIIAALHFEGSSWSKTVVETLEKMSPTSLKVTFKQMRAGGKLSLHEGLQMEFRIVNRLLLGHDFYEGVRSILLDKDFAPNWQPERLNLVYDDDVEAYFEGLDELELKF